MSIENTGQDVRYRVLFAVFGLAKIGKRDMRRTRYVPRSGTALASVCITVRTRQQ